MAICSSHVRTGLGLGALVAALLLAPAVASAQAAPAPSAGSAAPSAGASADAPVQTTVQTQNGRRVYVASQTIEIRGEIQRPYAFSLSGRASLGYTYLELPVHFVQEILDAVRRAPF